MLLLLFDFQENTLCDIYSIKSPSRFSHFDVFKFCIYIWFDIEIWVFFFSFIVNKWKIYIHFALFFIFFKKRPERDRLYDFFFKLRTSFRSFFGEGIFIICLVFFKFFVMVGSIAFIKWGWANLSIVLKSFSCSKTNAIFSCSSISLFIWACVLSGVVIDSEIQNLQTT